MNSLFSSVMNFFRSVGSFFLVNSEIEPPEEVEEYYYEDSICEPYTCCFTPYRLYLNHIEGGGIGYNKGYTTIGFFGAIPFSETGFMPLLDLRGHLFNNGRLAANIGTGFRYISYSTKTIFGLNVYYDWRKNEFHHFQQIGTGFEVLGACWAFRANVYVPFGKEIQNGHLHRFTYPGGFVATCQKQVKALNGVDAEVAYYKKSKCQSFSFYAGIGPYYYPRKCKDDIVGGMGRIIVTGWDVIDIEGRAYYDRVKNWVAQGRFAINVPIGRRLRTNWIRAGPNYCPLTCEEVCLLREIAALPVLRNEIIVTDKNCKWETNF